MRALIYALLIALTALHANAKECEDTYQQYTYFAKNIEGKYHFNDGSVYQGEVSKNHKFDGFGTYKSGCGWRYEGDWRSGKREGMGTYYYPDGRVYKGRFFMDDFAGFGVLRDAQGTTLKAGYWRHHKLAASKTSMDKERARLDALKGNNDVHSKIINAIKFALDGDDAEFHNPSNTIDQQHYAYDNCKYYALTSADYVDPRRPKEYGWHVEFYDFNKVNWGSAARRGYGDDAQIRLTCEGGCKGTRRNFVHKMGWSRDDEYIVFKAMPNISRTINAINDIKASCPGHSSIY